MVTPHIHNARHARCISLISRHLTETDLNENKSIQRVLNLSQRCVDSLVQLTDSICQSVAFTCIELTA